MWEKGLQSRNKEIPVSLQYGNQVIHGLCANFHAVFLQKKEKMDSSIMDFVSATLEKTT